MLNVSNNKSISFYLYLQVLRSIVFNVVLIDAKLKKHKSNSNQMTNLSLKFLTIKVAHLFRKFYKIVKCVILGKALEIAINLRKCV